MHRLKDISSAAPLEHIPFSMEKGSVLLFIIELIRNALGKSGSEEAHYHFLHNEILTLDQTYDQLRYFPLQFTIKLSHLLGFGPNLNTYTKQSFFDLQNGVFTKQIPAHPHYLNEDRTSIFYHLCHEIEEENTIEEKINKGLRKYFLDQMMNYFSLHIENFRKPNAQDVLSTVFDS